MQTAGVTHPQAVMSRNYARFCLEQCRAFLIHRLMNLGPTLTSTLLSGNNGLTNIVSRVSRKTSKQPANLSMKKIGLQGLPKVNQKTICK